MVAPLFIQVTQMAISKAAKSAYNKEYRAKNLEKLKARDASRYEENKEKNRLYAKKYYAKNKELCAEKGREYRLKNKEAISLRRRERLTNNPEYAEKVRARDRARYPERKVGKRDADLQKKYGITLDDYNQMLEKQNGECAICGAEQADSLKRPLVVDHCHDEGHVRGLLCNHCNMGIGQLNHDIGLLKKAINYLEAT